MNPSVHDDPYAVTTVDLLKAEAHYFVDRLIREHNEAKL
jgi:hypothetical protein